MNPRSTDCEADALTTTPFHLFEKIFPGKWVLSLTGSEETFGKRHDTLLHVLRPRHMGADKERQITNVIEKGPPQDVNKPTSE